MLEFTASLRLAGRKAERASESSPDAARLDVNDKKLQVNVSQETWPPLDIFTLQGFACNCRISGCQRVSRPVMRGERAL